MAEDSFNNSNPNQSFNAPNTETSGTVGRHGKFVKLKKNKKRVFMIKGRENGLVQVEGFVAEKELKSLDAEEDDDRIL